MVLDRKFITRMRPTTIVLISPLFCCKCYSVEKIEHELINYFNLIIYIDTNVKYELSKIINKKRSS